MGSPMSEYDSATSAHGSSLRGKKKKWRISFFQKMLGIRSEPNLSRVNTNVNLKYPAADDFDDLSTEGEDFASSIQQEVILVLQIGFCPKKAINPNWEHSLFVLGLLTSYFLKKSAIAVLLGVCSYVFGDLAPAGLRNIIQVSTNLSSVAVPIEKQRLCEALIDRSIVKSPL